MRLTVLGSASGISMPGSGHASVALETGGGLYIFDLGEPVGRTLLESGLPIEKLRAAFVSHMHSDHSGGLVQFVKNLHLYHNHPDYLPQVDALTLAVPSEAVEPLMDFMTTCYMFPEKLRLALDLIGIEEGAFYDDGCAVVTARRTSHFDAYRKFVATHERYRRLKCQAFSFVVEAEGKRLVYSGDIGGMDDIASVAQGADLLILEVGHTLPLTESLQRLDGLGIRRILLTHIFPDYNDRRDELRREADSVLPGVVTVANDMTAVEL